jgi:hypothetical protein
MKIAMPKIVIPKIAMPKIVIQSAAKDPASSGYCPNTAEALNPPPAAPSNPRRSASFQNNPQKQ